MFYVVRLNRSDNGKVEKYFPLAHMLPSPGQWTYTSKTTDRPRDVNAHHDVYNTTTTVSPALASWVFAIAIVSTLYQLHNAVLLFLGRWSWADRYRTHPDRCPRISPFMRYSWDVGTSLRDRCHWFSAGWEFDLSDLHHTCTHHTPNHPSERSHVDRRLRRRWLKNAPPSFPVDRRRRRTVRVRTHHVRDNIIPTRA